jgi:hypothetical protein
MRTTLAVLKPHENNNSCSGASTGDLTKCKYNSVSNHPIKGYHCTCNYELLRNYGIMCWCNNSPSPFSRPFPCPCCMNMSIVHAHVHGTCPHPCLWCMSTSVVHVHFHAACPHPWCTFSPCPSCMSLSMQHVYVILHLTVCATCPCCMSMSMLCVHVHAYVHKIYSLSMLPGNAACPYCMNIHGHEHTNGYEYGHINGHGLGHGKRTLT